MMVTSFLISSFDHYKRKAIGTLSLEKAQKSLGLQCDRVLFALQDFKPSQDCEQTSPPDIDHRILKHGYISDMRFITSNGEAGLSFAVSQRFGYHSDPDNRDEHQDLEWCLQAFPVSVSQAKWKWNLSLVPETNFGIAKAKNDATKQELLARTEKIEVWISKYGLHIYQRDQTDPGTLRKVYHNSIPLFRKHFSQGFDDLRNVLYAVVARENAFSYCLAAIDLDTSHYPAQNEIQEVPNATPRLNNAKHLVRLLHDVKHHRSFAIDVPNGCGYFVSAVPSSERKVPMMVREISLESVKSKLFEPELFNQEGFDPNQQLTSAYLESITTRNLTLEILGEPSHHLHQTGPYLVLVRISPTFYEEYNSGQFITDDSEVIVILKKSLSTLFDVDLKIRSHMDHDYSEGCNNDIVHAHFSQSYKLHTIALFFEFHRVTFLLFDSHRIKKDKNAFVMKHMSLGYSYVTRCLSDFPLPIRSCFRRKKYSPFFLLRKADLRSRETLIQTQVDEEIDPFPYEEMPPQSEGVQIKGAFMLEQWRIKW